MKANPCDAVERPRTQPSPPRGLSADQVKLLLDIIPDTVKGRRDRAIVLPLVRPGLGALGIFTFVNIWNSFLWPLIVLRGDTHYTLPVGMATLNAQLIKVDYGAIMVGSTVISLPVIALFLLMQRHFISGLTLGVVRE